MKSIRPFFKVLAVLIALFAIRGATRAAETPTSPGAIRDDPQFLELCRDRPELTGSVAGTQKIRTIADRFSVTTEEVNDLLISSCPAYPDAAVPARTHRAQQDQNQKQVASVATEVGARSSAAFFDGSKEGLRELPDATTTTAAAPDGRNESRSAAGIALRAAPVRTPLAVPAPGSGVRPSEAVGAPGPVWQAAQAALLQLPGADGFVDALWRRDVEARLKSSSDVVRTDWSEDSVVVEFKDGSVRRESESGAYEVRHGGDRVEADPAKGSFLWEKEGKEFVQWQPGEGGALRGRFRGTAFSLNPGEDAHVDPSGERLLILGPEKNEPAAVVGWVERGGSESRVIAGLGLAQKSFDGQRANYVVLLETSSLREIAAGRLSFDALPSWALKPGDKRAFGMFLAAYAGCFKGIAQAVSGEAGRGVERAYILNGQLHLELRGAGGLESVAADIAQQDGRAVVRAYHMVGAQALKQVYEPEAARITTFSQDAGDVAKFRLFEQHVYKGGRWEKSLLNPFELESAPGNAKLMALAVATGGGELVSGVFSPIQSGLYGFEGLLATAGGAVLGGDYGVAAKVSGVYTLRQAKLNERAGRGTESEQAMEAYQTALGVLDAKQRDSFQSSVDAEVVKRRQKQYGELWKFHRDEAISTAERANAAAAMFGLKNAAAQQMEAGRDGLQQGNLSGLVHYAVAAGATAGELWLTGAGFGAASTPLKAAVAIGRADKLGQVARITARGGAEKILRIKSLEGTATALGRGEAATFLAPMTVGALNSVSELAQANDSDKRWEAGHELFSTAAGMGGLAKGLTRRLVGKVLTAGAEAPTSRSPESRGATERALSGDPAKQVGDRVALSRSHGGLTNGEIRSIWADGKAEVVFSDPLRGSMRKLVQLSDLRPSLPSGLSDIRSGTMVSIPRSNGGRTDAKVASVSGGVAEVQWRENGQPMTKRVSIQGLSSPNGSPEQAVAKAPSVVSEKPGPGSADQAQRPRGPPHPDDAVIAEQFRNAYREKFNLPDRSLTEAQRLANIMREDLPGAKYYPDRIFYDRDGSVPPQGIKLRVGDYQPEPGDGPAEIQAGREAILKAFLAAARKIEGNGGSPINFKVTILMDAMKGSKTQEGKFITIYPEDPIVARELAVKLDSALNQSGLRGGALPPEDFRFGRSGLIAWRYGGFTGRTLEVPNGSGGKRIVADDRASARGNLAAARFVPDMDFWFKEAGVSP